MTGGCGGGGGGGGSSSSSSSSSSIIIIIIIINNQSLSTPSLFAESYRTAAWHNRQCIQQIHILYLGRYTCHPDVFVAVTVNAIN